MKNLKKLTAVVALLLICVFALTACKSFYNLFVEEDSSADGVYYVIYDSTNTDKEIEAIPDVHLMKADIRDAIKTYGLSYEVTIAFDMETKNEASLTCYYYHNRKDENASDYCRIGISYMGSYSMEGNKITFKTESDGYNTAFCYVGSDYAGLDTFNQFSFAEDKSNGVWAYENAPWDYGDAVIDAAVMEGVPKTIVFTVSGKKIVTWEEAK